MFEMPLPTDDDSELGRKLRYFWSATFEMMAPNIDRALLKVLAMLCCEFPERRMLTTLCEVLLEAKSDAKAAGRSPADLAEFDQLIHYVAGCIGKLPDKPPPPPPASG